MGRAAGSIVIHPSLRIGRLASAALAVAALGSASFGASCGGSGASGGGGAGGGCAAELTPHPCFDAIEAQCCAELQGCLGDGGASGCTACLRSGDATACASPKAIALVGCVLDRCSAECGDGAPTPACDAPASVPSRGACVTVAGDVACNPITNEGCDAGSGDACDYDAGTFACYPPPNDAAICAPCGGKAGFCGPGMSCYERVTIDATNGLVIRGSCARSCCDDGDCGDGATCEDRATVGGTSVGVCLTKPTGGSGGGGGAP
ncbi:MAG TPA: hypothetical protein VHB21_03410 [Minicystis sp.]|nr:hypothetical protein [Minicystis sp.]